MDMMDVFKWIPDGEKDRLKAFEDTFSTPGWKLIIEWAEAESVKETVRAATATTWDQNRIAHGTQLAMNQFANLAEYVLTEYANMAEQAKLDSEVEEAEDYE